MAKGQSGQSLGGPLTARIESRDGATYVTLAGAITEAADFTPLTTQRSPMVIDLSAVDRINSIGVRNWVHFVKQCETAGLDVVCDRCSPVIVQQISMISNFMGARTRVRSLFAPYLCPTCSAEHLQLYEVKPGVPLAVPTQIACPKCGAVTHLDELEAMYPALFAGR